MERSRIITAYIIVIISFTILFFRYAYLQIFSHVQLLKQAINNYSSIVSTLPTRGTIIDRNGILLAENKSSYVLAMLGKDYNNFKKIESELNKYVNITSIDKKKLQLQLKNNKRYDWLIIKDDLMQKEIANISSHLYKFPEISIFSRIKRYYPYDELYAPSIGYVAKVSDIDKEALKKKHKSDKYLNNDYIGKNGLEYFYEDILRGFIGRKVIKTDARGNEIALIDNISATDGQTLQLTIDHNLQKYASSLLGNRKGAIIALDPNTGGVLVFVSKPSFNPNWFIDGINFEDWKELIDNPQKPLLNRVIQGSYPPGSTFKPFMALGALQLGIRDPKATMYDPGYFILPGSNHKFRDSVEGGFGLINMEEAIAHSSDVYFYKLGLDMGIDRIDKIMPYFNLGSKTGIDLPHENTGLLPSKEWKSKRFKNDPYQKNWQLADSVTIGIGQGFNNYTPLQMAFATSIIANNGNAFKPHLLDKVVDKDGKVVESFLPILHKTPFKKDNIEFIKKAMQKVITEGNSTSISYGLSYTMAGKTGTAQVVRMNQNNRRAKFEGSQYKDHSWFIAFAPVENPKIVAAVIVENGGFGIGVAAPIVRKIFDFYLLNKNDIFNDDEDEDKNDNEDENDNVDN